MVQIEKKMVNNSVSSLPGAFVLFISIMFVVIVDVLTLS